MRLRSFALGTLALLVLAGGALVWRPAIPEAPPSAGFDAALVTQGAQLAAIGNCAACHAGPAGQPYAGGLPLQTPFGPVYASNITPDRETGIGAWSGAAFRRALRDGVSRTGGFLYPAFPYNHYTHVTDADIAALYAFLMTRPAVTARTPAARLVFPMNIRPVMAVWNLLFLDHGPVARASSGDAGGDRGAYLVEGLGHCQACHTPRNALGAEDPSRAFAGGLADGWEGPGLTAATSPAAIPWGADAVYRFLRHGLDDQHAAAAGPMGVVSHDLSAVPEADVRAMAAYIARFSGPPDPTREQAVQARAAAAAVAPPALDGMPGAATFAGACAGCHGAGAPMMLHGRPSLSLGSAVTAASPRNAAQVILHGLRPPANQAGPWMPGFADALSDADIADVMAYLRARFADRPAWTDLPADIHRIRKETGS